MASLFWGAGACARKTCSTDSPPLLRHSALPTAPEPRTRAGQPSAVPPCRSRASSALRSKRACLARLRCNAAAATLVTLQGARLDGFHHAWQTGSAGKLQAGHERCPPTGGPEMARLACISSTRTSHAPVWGITVTRRTSESGCCSGCKDVGWRRG